MKLTNRLDLPQAILNAVKNDPYSKGDADISITTLIDSPRKRILTRQYESEIEEDVSDRIWSLIGQSVHSILERASSLDESVWVERRYHVEVEGWKVSGAIDLFSPLMGLIQDYKVTSVWSVIYGDRGKWERQLNCYAALLRRQGCEVKKLQAIAILRDWSKTKAEMDPAYPQAQVVNIDLPLWDELSAERYLRERVILHKQAEVSLPECTSDERWEKETTWAVKERGKKNAIRGGIHTSEEAALAHAKEKATYYVEHRPGRSGRCASYCPVKKFCTQYQSEQSNDDAC